MDQVGKRGSGVCEQPTDCPGQETVGCPPFKTNECKSHIGSNLDTIQLIVDLGKKNKLTFLLDTGADLSVIKISSLQPGIKYTLKRGISIKGISNTIMKTEGTIILKSFTDTHETTHTFHVVGNEVGIQYDGILGRNFFEDKQSIINYCDQQIIMVDVVVKFDPRPDKISSENCKLTLKARSDNIVKLPTKSMGHGLISQKELIPGIYLAESLTKEMNG